MKENINLEDVDHFLDGYELPEHHENALINLEEVDFYLERKKQFHIPQVDGLDAEGAKIPRNYFYSPLGCYVKSVLHLEFRVSNEYSPLSLLFRVKVP